MLPEGLCVLVKWPVQKAYARQILIEKSIEGDIKMITKNCDLFNAKFCFPANPPVRTIITDFQQIGKLTGK